MEVIDKIYAAVDEPRLWNDFLDFILEDKCFAACALGYQTGLHDRLIRGLVRGPDPVQIEELYSEVLPNNPLMYTNFVLSLNPQVILDHEIMDRESFHDTSYYKWLDSIGAHRIMAGLCRVGNNDVVHFAGYVKKGHEPTQLQYDMMYTLLPHLKRALHLSRKIESLEAKVRRSESAIDRAHFGCIIVDENLDVVWSNGYAQFVLDKEDSLTHNRGYLEAVHTAERKRLDKALRDAVKMTNESTFHGMQRIQKTDGGLLDVLISPLSPFGHPMIKQSSGAMIFVADPDYVEEGIANRLKLLYGLTPTESEVTQWLLSGLSVGRIATVFNRSPNTIRHHIKHVLHKCGVSSQAQLVGLIHRGIAGLVDDPTEFESPH